MTLEEFKAGVSKVNEPRKHKITGSLGVYDAYKWIRKNKWFDIGRPLTEKEFYTIVRSVGNYLAESICEGNPVNLPCRMGLLELRKNAPYIKIKENGKVEAHLPIDWDSTLKLWYSDEDAFKNKQLVKFNSKEIFRVLYNRTHANYENNSFFEFQVNRDIKRTLNKRIKQGRIDSFLSTR